MSKLPIKLMTSTCGAIFPWITTDKGTVYMNNIKELEKMFKVKIKPREGDLCLNSDSKRRPSFFTKGKWVLVNKNGK